MSKLRNARQAWIGLALLVALAVGLGLAASGRPALADDSNPAAPAPARQGKLVFVATTGAEDMQTLVSSFRHAKVAKESGYLSDVVWLAYGRSVSVLDPDVKAIPDDVRVQARAAAAAGVRLVACANALEKHGIATDRIEPRAEVVPSGVVELSRLVAEGYQVIRY